MSYLVKAVPEKLTWRCCLHLHGPKWSTTMSAFQPMERRKRKREAGKPPPSLPVISHWSELDHMVKVAARNAGK